MTLSIILVLLFLVFVYLLFTPIILSIDTISNTYYMRFSGLVKASVLGDKEAVLKVKVKILFFHFYIYPFRRNKDIKLKKTKNNLKPIKRRKKMRLQKGLRLLKSFKVKRFFLNIDTGDCIANAKLYPVFALLNYKGGNFNINFDGRNQLILFIQNRPIHIIKSFINI